MPTPKKPATELPTTADWSRINKVNSQRSPWRKPAHHGSPRQRKCARYFDELEAKGDTRRVPRPELDPD